MAAPERLNAFKPDVHVSFLAFAPIPKRTSASNETLKRFKRQRRGPYMPLVSKLAICFSRASGKGCKNGEKESEANGEKESEAMRVRGVYTPEAERILRWRSTAAACHGAFDS